MQAHHPPRHLVRVRARARVRVVAWVRGMVRVGVRFRAPRHRLSSARTVTQPAIEALAPTHLVRVRVRARARVGVRARARIIVTIS